MTSATASMMNLVASTLAALATVVLAIFAKRQWHVMKESNEAAERQNTLARDRWEREDKIRAEENRPKAAFGFSDCLKCNLKLSCTNLGTVGFLVVGMQILPLLGDPEKILFGKEAEILVPVGEEKQVTFDLGKYREMHEHLTKILNNPTRAKHFGIKLILQGPVGTVETNLEGYRVNRFREKGGSFYGVHSWRTIPQPVGDGIHFDGVLTKELVICPRCANLYIVDLVANLGIAFPVQDCGTAFEAGRNRMVAMAQNLEKQCLEHFQEESSRSI